MGVSGVLEEQTVPEGRDGVALGLAGHGEGVRQVLGVLVQLGLEGHPGRAAGEAVCSGTTLITTPPSPPPPARLQRYRYKCV